MSNIVRLLISVQVFCIIALSVTVVERHPVNHLGFDVRLVGVLPACGLARVFIDVKRGRGGAGLLFYSSLALLVLLVVLDFGNVLLDYERWIGKGMPGSFLGGTSVKP